MIEFLGSTTGRVFILVAIFASVFLLAQVLLRAGVENRSYAHAINKRMKLIAQNTDREAVMGYFLKNDPTRDDHLPGILGRAMRSLRRNLMMAALPIGPTQVALMMAGGFVVLLLIALVLVWSANFTVTIGVVQIITAFAAAVAIGVPLLVINFIAERRRKKMQAQFPVALDIFVRALKSGHPVASAIDLLTREMEDPLGSEFGLASDEVSYGAELTDALSGMADRWNLEDIRMFVVCLSLQSETGGNLAEILENLAHVIRERASLFLKVRALSSEGRMTAWLLSALPIIMFVLLFTLNPPFYLEVATDPIFMIGFPAMIVWFLIGVFVIKKMVNLKV